MVLIKNYMFRGDNYKCKLDLDMPVSQIKIYIVLVRTQYLQKPLKFFEKALKNIDKKI